MMFALVVVAAMFESGNAFADALLINDGRFVAVDVQGSNSVIQPYGQVSFIGQRTPSLPFSDFDGRISQSAQKSSMTALSFTSLHNVTGSYPEPGWVMSFSQRSVFDVTFQLTSVYDYQTSALLWIQQSMPALYGGPSSFAHLTYYLTGPTGDVFRYAGNPWFSFPDNFAASGTLDPGTYRLYGEAAIIGGVYRSENYSGQGKLDLSMALSPVAVPAPEGDLPLIPMALTIMVLFYVKRCSDRDWLDKAVRSKAPADPFVCEAIRI